MKIYALTHTDLTGKHVDTSDGCLHAFSIVILTSYLTFWPGDLGQLHWPGLS
jgi:hypothetical protein